MSCHSSTLQQFPLKWILSLKLCSLFPLTSFQISSWKWCCKSASAMQNSDDFRPFSFKKCHSWAHHMLQFPPKMNFCDKTLVRFVLWEIYSHYVSILTAPRCEEAALGRVTGNFFQEQNMQSCECTLSIRISLLPFTRSRTDYTHLFTICQLPQVGY